MLLLFLLRHTPFRLLCGSSWVICCPSPDFEVKSQFVVVDFARLEQTADLHGALAFLVLGLLSRLFTVLGEQIGVVACKFLELDEEIAEGKLEASNVIGLCEQVGDELLDLSAAKVWLAGVSGKAMTELLT